MASASPTSSARSTPTALADQIATAFKACAVWPRQNPRVQQACTALAAELHRWVSHPDWLPIRVRGETLSIGNDRLDQPSAVAAWLVARCRAVGLQGIEIAASVAAEHLIDFGVALAAARLQEGNCTLDWRSAHPAIRLLELVFDGEHVAGAVGELGGPIQTAEAVLKAELAQQLVASPAIAARLRHFEQICGNDKSQTSVEFDLVRTVVGMLPKEVAYDWEQSQKVVDRVLAEAEVVAMMHLRNGQPPTVDSARRLALDVAQSWFASVEGGFGLHADVPQGDVRTVVEEGFDPDVDALQADLQQLPSRDYDDMDPAFTPRQLSGELCGIHLHVLMSPQRAEAQQAALAGLATALQQIGPPQLAQLDTYLRPRSVDAPAPVGDANAIAILQLLDRTGRGALARERAYVDAGFVSRTFPGAFPLCARLCGKDPGGVETLRSGLSRLDRSKVESGFEDMWRRGIADEPGVLEAVRAIGGKLVLPFLRCALAIDHPDAREALAAQLRRLPLPTAESAALRCLRAPGALPTPYLTALCRLHEQGGAEDASVRSKSAELVRGFVAAMPATTPVDQQVSAVDCLRHFPSPATTELLTRLAKKRWWMPLNGVPAAVREQAERVLDDLTGWRSTK